MIVLEILTTHVNLSEINDSYSYHLHRTIKPNDKSIENPTKEIIQCEEKLDQITHYYS